MSLENQKTLEVYEQYFSEYINGTSLEVTGLQEEWLRDALEGLPESARILEVGSAGGRDAKFIMKQGYRVEATDATNAAVKILRTRGFEAKKLNILTDKLEGEYDLVVAAAVFIHFTESQLWVSLEKIKKHLSASGRLAFTVKQGYGDEWTSHKMSAPRYFHYWQAQELEDLLIDVGYETYYNRITDSKKWLHFICKPRKV